jgi:hypothetical protein
MPALSPLASASRGFTLAGTLGSVAVVAAVMAVCAPIVVRRLRAHAQGVEQIVRRAEAAIDGSLNQAASLADATARQMASGPPPAVVRDEGGGPWPAGPVDPLVPYLGSPDRADTFYFRPRWPWRENRPPLFWRPRFSPRPPERRLWPREPVWRWP